MGDWPDGGGVIKGDDSQLPTMVLLVDTRGVQHLVNVKAIEFVEPLLSLGKAVDNICMVRVRGMERVIYLPLSVSMVGLQLESYGCVRVVREVAHAAREQIEREDRRAQKGEAGQ